MSSNGPGQEAVYACCDAVLCLEHKTMSSLTACQQWRPSASGKTRRRSVSKAAATASSSIPPANPTTRTSRPAKRSVANEAKLPTPPRKTFFFSSHTLPHLEQGISVKKQALKESNPPRKWDKNFHRQGQTKIVWVSCDWTTTKQTSHK